MAKEEIKHTNLSVKERNFISLNGVCNVIGFDEGYVTLATNEGKIIIEGEGLKIESLSKQGGEISISGKVTGVFYSEKKQFKSPFLKLFS